MLFLAILGIMVLRIVLICNPIRETAENDMYICVCNAITEREVRGAVSLGCKNMADLRNDLGVATCCGKCEPDARRVLREFRLASAGSSIACAGD